VRLSSANTSQLEAAGKELKEHLATYGAIYYVTDTADSAQSEAVISVFDNAKNMNVYLSDLGKQVRQAFYGEEVQKIARGVDDVKVRLRMPRKDRMSFDSLNDMRIRAVDGTAVPFSTVGKVNYQTAYTGIRREDRQRSLTVIASIEESKMVQKDRIQKELEKNYFPKLKEKYPDINFGFSGGFTGQNEFMQSMLSGLAKGLVVIYILFAVAFRSYFKPFIIFTALPFGYMGAVLGHMFFGMNISIYSIMGILAAFGVVINDNLVLMDYIGRLRKQGYDTIRAVETAAEERFRAIFLTSFTTFIGLVPLMMETSVQAQFLKPTVISLAFGVLFATVITLFLVPMLYISFSNARKHMYRWAGKQVPTYEAAAPAE
jgi:multidrug efflux pump subunit AcrB